MIDDDTDYLMRERSTVPSVVDREEYQGLSTEAFLVAMERQPILCHECCGRGWTGRLYMWKSRAWVHSSRCARCLGRRFERVF